LRNDTGKVEEFLKIKVHSPSAARTAVPCECRGRSSGCKQRSSRSLSTAGKFQGLVQQPFKVNLSCVLPNQSNNL